MVLNRGGSMLGWSVEKMSKFWGVDIANSQVIQGFAVDSRKVMDGHVFFALKGDQVDGHDYLSEAFDKGAIAAVVSKDCRQRFPFHTLIVVDDVLHAMQTLASNILSMQKKKIVAITGSVGKTTTKEFVATLLSSHYKVYKTPGNANSQIGLPLSILNKKDCEEDVMVLEMGMTQRGHIKNLVNIAPPDVSVITKIAPAHIEYFSDGLEGIADAKSEILAHDKTSLAIINAQAAAFSAISSKVVCKKITYSSVGVDARAKADYWLESSASNVRLCSEDDTSPWMSLPFQATHILENFTAAAIVARKMGVSWQAIASSCSSLGLHEMRFEKIKRCGVTFINDCYNANPESMKAALANLPAAESGGRKIAVLGHMVELGSYSDDMHHDIGVFASLHVDKLLCIGKKCLPMKEGFLLSGRSVEHFDLMEEMKKSLFNQIGSGDVVLIKASNSVGLWKVLETEN
jgi:UDP-N-acetylmuramoyl-tripeptide--D-alanyl-D-alanine ligase